MSRVARVPQSDDEQPAAVMSASVPLRAIGASLALGLVLGAAVTLAWRSPGMSGVDETTSSLEFVGLADADFTLPHLTLPPSPVDKFKEGAAEFRDKWGINNIRHDQITLCVTNLNLGLWKLIQWAAVMGETVENCPGGFTNIDKKIACNINLAALVASMSAALSFFASTAFLCTGKDNPDAACTTVLGATFETFATFPAAENQLALFCPKNAYEETVVKGDVTVFSADRRLRGLASPSNSTAFADRELYKPPPEEPLELLFCSWQIAQTVWFFVRAGPLIEIATKVCPAPPGGQAACSEVVNEVMLMFFNAAKFIAAASTNCIDGIDVRAGCALGSLNLISAFSSAAGVISALADGVCTDLKGRKKEAVETRVNRKIRKIHLIRSMTLRRLQQENKLTSSASDEASKLIQEDEEAQDLPADRSVPELLRGLGLRTNVTSRRELEDLMLAKMGTMDPTPLKESGRQKMMAKVHHLQEKYPSGP